MKELRDYVRDVLDSTRSLKFDEGVFQSYLVIGRSLITRALQCSDTYMLGSKIQECLGMFKTSWDLTTGTSMEVLWNSFRPSTARDSRELDLVLRVERLADRFDSIVWRSNAPLDTITKLRRSILGVSPLEQSANLQDEDALKARVPFPDLLPFLTLNSQLRKLLMRSRMGSATRLLLPSLTFSRNSKVFVSTLHRRQKANLPESAIP